MATATWDPDTEPQAVGDTTYLLDPDAEALLAPGDGGFLAAGNSGAIQGVPPWVGTSRVDVVAGRFTRDGLASNNSDRGLLWMPSHGLLPTDEFTIEVNLKSTADWSGISKTPFRFSTGTGEYIQLRIAGNAIIFELFHDHFASGDVTKSLTTTATPLADTWHNVAATLKSGTCKLYLDGVLKDTETGVLLPPIWADWMRSGGLELCGSGSNGATGISLSDFAIHRTARIPATPVTLRDSHTVTVSATPRGDSVRQALLGTTHDFGLEHDTDIPAVEAACAPIFKGLRVGRHLSSTPIKAGAPDATYPTLGQSGDYSYDWQMVDRSIAFQESLGQPFYPTITSCPSILGGLHAPPSGTDLTTERVDGNGTFHNDQVPNDFAAFATMAADLIYHVVEDLGTPVPYLDIWNEPDLMAAWGGVEGWLDFYAAVAPVLRAVCPETKIGGPGTSSFLASWTEALIDRCDADALPLDFICYHGYDGNTANANRIRGLVDRYRAAVGEPAGLEIINTEWNAVSPIACWGSNAEPWKLIHLGISDFAAASTATHLIEYQRLGYTEAKWWNVCGNVDSESFESVSAINDDAEWWAPGNTMRLWSMLEDFDVLNVTVSADPGVKALACTDGENVSVLLTNFHYHPADPITVSVEVPDATAATGYLIDADDSNIYDGGGVGTLETITPPTVTDGVAEIDLAYRSVVLLNFATEAPPTHIPRICKLDGEVVALS